MQIQTEQPKNGADEHILVCLSSSPSNARIIHTAAKMAKVLHAKFTAIYVQTDSVESEKNRLRLEQNIQLAQGLGAEIIMTHGENVDRNDICVGEIEMIEQKTDRRAYGK